jgi:hypothetical protein
MAILDKFNTKDVLGKYAGAENRNPTEIDQYSTGQYNISQFSYPDDVTTKADLQHYVAFYINVRQKTKFKPEKIVDVDVSSRGQNRLSAQGIAEGATVAAGAAVGLSAFNFTNKVLGTADIIKTFSSAAKSGSTRGGTGIVAKTLLQNLGALGAGAVAGVATYEGIKQIQSLSSVLAIEEPKRIQDAVVLHIEKPPAVKYSMKYTDVDLGILGGLFGGSSAIETSLGTRATEAAISGGLSLLSLPKAAIAAQLLGATSPKRAILGGAKVATNPFREVMFESISPREFNFSYTFLPKSETEVQNVKNIIDLFKFHMHPELSAGGFFYVYPSEFEIVYYFQGKENRYINKISTCVMTDMDVKYGGEYFSSFKDGAPAEIIMTLSFRELELLTKERIVKGY